MSSASAHLLDYVDAQDGDARQAIRATAEAICREEYGRSLDPSCLLWTFELMAALVANRSRDAIWKESGKSMARWVPLTMPTVSSAHPCPERARQASVVEFERRKRTEHVAVSRPIDLADSQRGCLFFIHLICRASKLVMESRGVRTAALASAGLFETHCALGRNFGHYGDAMFMSEEEETFILEETMGYFEIHLDEWVERAISDMGECWISPLHLVRRALMADPDLQVSSFRRETDPEAGFNRRGLDER